MSPREQHLALLLAAANARIETLEGELAIAADALREAVDTLDVLTKGPPLRPVVALESREG